MVFISPTNEFEGLLNVMEAIYASVIVLCHAFILGYKKGEWWLWFFVNKDEDQEDQLFLLGNFKEGSILAIARGDLVYPYMSHVLGKAAWLPFNRIVNVHTFFCFCIIDFIKTAY